MPVVMICSRDDDSPSVTDYNDDLIYQLLLLIVAYLMFLTYVTVCVCHAELKGCLLT